MDVIACECYVKCPSANLLQLWSKISGVKNYFSLICSGESVLCLYIWRFIHLNTFKTWKLLITFWICHTYVLIMALKSRTAAMSLDANLNGDRKVVFVLCNTVTLRDLFLTCTDGNELIYNTNSHSLTYARGVKLHFGDDLYTCVFKGNIMTQCFYWKQRHITAHPYVLYFIVFGGIF